MIDGQLEFFESLAILNKMMNKFSKSFNMSKFPINKHLYKDNSLIITKLEI